MKTMNYLVVIGLVLLLGICLTPTPGKILADTWEEGDTFLFYSLITYERTFENDSYTLSIEQKQEVTVEEYNETSGLVNISYRQFNLLSDNMEPEEDYQAFNVSAAALEDYQFFWIDVFYDLGTGEFEEYEDVVYNEFGGFLIEPEWADINDYLLDSALNESSIVWNTFDPIV